MKTCDLSKITVIPAVAERSEAERRDPGPWALGGLDRERFRLDRAATSPLPPRRRGPSVLHCCLVAKLNWVPAFAGKTIQCNLLQL